MPVKITLKYIEFCFYINEAPCLFFYSIFLTKLAKINQINQINPQRAKPFVVRLYNACNAVLD